MAVQQNKKSKSRKGMRRSHHKIDVPNIIVCKCGESKISHAICPGCGTYRERQFVNTSVATE